MAVDWTTTGLIEKVRNRAAIPDSQNLFPDSRILDIANEELQQTVVPDIMAAREEYFVYYEDQDVDQNQSQYYIPERAIGTKLRNVCFVQNQGDPEGELAVPLIRLAPENVIGLPMAGLGYGITGTPGYVVRNNWIILYGPIQGGVVMRMFYFMRPGYLVQTSEAAQVTAINGSIVSCANVPTDWTTGEIVDVIGHQPPFNYRFIDQTTTLIAGNDITLPDVTGIEVGDWIALRCESPIPQIPADCQPLLAQAVSVYIANTLGDAKAIQAETARYEKMRRDAMTMIDNRVEGQGEKVVSRSGVRSWVRRNRYYGGY